jgi:hypothetical protein
MFAVIRSKTAIIQPTLQRLTGINFAICFVCVCVCVCVTWFLWEKNINCKWLERKNSQKFFMPDKNEIYTLRCYISVGGISLEQWNVGGYDGLGMWLRWLRQEMYTEVWWRNPCKRSKFTWRWGGGGEEIQMKIGCEWEWLRIVCIGGLCDEPSGTVLAIYKFNSFEVFPEICRFKNKRVFSAFEYHEKFWESGIWTNTSFIQ